MYFYCYYNTLIIIKTFFFFTFNIWGKTAKQLVIKRKQDRGRFNLYGKGPAVIWLLNVNNCCYNQCFFDRPCSEVYIDPWLRKSLGFCYLRRLKMWSTLQPITDIPQGLIKGQLWHHCKIRATCCVFWCLIWPQWACTWTHAQDTS